VSAVDDHSEICELVTGRKDAKSAYSRTTTKQHRQLGRNEHGNGK
jgi:hypothetical protein